VLRQPGRVRGDGPKPAGEVMVITVERVEQYRRLGHEHARVPPEPAAREVLTCRRLVGLLDELSDSSGARRALDGEPGALPDVAESGGRVGRCDPDGDDPAGARHGHGLA